MINLNNIPVIANFNDMFTACWIRIDGLSCGISTGDRLSCDALMVRLR